MEIELLKSLKRDDVLWRYMSLDKFVDLISGSKLFFSPLSFYAETDPYEGYPPLVALEAMYNIGNKPHEDLQATLLALESSESASHIIRSEAYKRARASLDNRFPDFKKRIDAVFRGTLVSCWYKSDHQSEAMWKLYSDQYKGVAIRTTVGDLEDALLNADSEARKVYIGQVKYIDYDDSNLTPKDCTMDGHIVPMLKRISFSHEQEVRAFFIGDADYSNFESFLPSSRSLSVDVNKLIKTVYISPYAKAPFPQSVRAICSAFGLTCPVLDSGLLSGVEKLFSFNK
jgi:hypothetical protein